MPEKKRADRLREAIRQRGGLLAVRSLLDNRMNLRSSAQSAKSA